MRFTPSLTAARRSMPGGATRALLLVALLAACGSDPEETSSAGTSPPDSTTTTTTTASSATEDRALAGEALLTAADLPDAGWGDGPSDHTFPMSADLAATVPTCADFVDVVFEGGADNGEAVAGVLARGADLAWTHAIVFPDEEGATAMMEAVSETAFDECWADFNEVSAVEMPFGITAATYDPIEPPDLSVSADAFNIEHVSGTAEVSGSEFEDSCVCAFAKSGRGVVIVHSAEPTMDIAERTATVQAAVDKLTATLAQS
jgi:hypothetical protein